MPVGIKGMRKGGVMSAVMNAVDEASAQVGARLEAEPVSTLRAWQALREAARRSEESGI